ncbi:hypothetical protein [Desulforhopalus sp. 52FAK]
MSKQNSGKKVVLVGHLYENVEEVLKKEGKNEGSIKDDMGKFLLSIPKDLRRKIKFESEEQGFKNASSYICHILLNRED